MTVYCSKCGARNEDSAQNCIQCGQPLYATGVGRSRREEEMCFGLPRHWGGVIFGVFLIIIGFVYLLQQYYKAPIELGWVILIFIGILIVIGGLYRSSRR
jgi:hypothetical protein